MKSRSSYRIILPWVLLFIYFLGNMKVVMPYIEYRINYDFISNVLCINKDNPDLKCLGKCHLAKELEKTSEESAMKKETSSTQSLDVAPAEAFTLSFSDCVVLIQKAAYFYLHPALVAANPENSTPPPQS